METPSPYAAFRDYQPGLVCQADQVAYTLQQVYALQRTAADFQGVETRRGLWLYYVMRPAPDSPLWRFLCISLFSGYVETRDFKRFDYAAGYAWDQSGARPYWLLGLIPPFAVTPWHNRPQPANYESLYRESLLLVRWAGEHVNACIVAAGGMDKVAADPNIWAEYRRRVRFHNLVTRRAYRRGALHSGLLENYPAAATPTFLELQKASIPVSNPECLG
jgi:hypothetical protein